MIKDISGEKFGRLVVVSYAGNGKWNCLCDCGRTVVVFGSNLKRKNTRSCGCLKIRKYQDRTMSAKKSLYQKYRTMAFKRNLEFDIDFDSFIKIIGQNCFYCGRKPNQSSNRKYYREKFFYNGLDRVNNNFGYTKNNIVPSCIVCNRMKWDRSQNEFFQWIKNVHGRWFKQKG